MARAGTGAAVNPGATAAALSGSNPSARNSIPLRLAKIVSISEGAPLFTKGENQPSQKSSIEMPGVVTVGR